jgi:hypothetical protein
LRIPRHGELAAAFVELLFQHGLDLIETVLERCDFGFPADKEHFIRLRLSDRT